MSREHIVEKKNFYYVIAGSFRQKVEQDSPEAVRRDWETPDGKKGTKYERHVQGLFGFITNVQFFDGDYGRTVQITLDPDEDGVSPQISLNTSSREGTDFLRKLPNVNLKKEVKLSPYSFNDDAGLERRGLTIYQQDEADNFSVKILDFYRDFEKKENINGMPNPPKSNDEMTKNAWKAYFLTVDDFLVENIQKIVTFDGPKSEEQQADEEFAALTKQEPPNILKGRVKSKEETEEGINLDEVPF